MVATNKLKKKTRVQGGKKKLNNNPNKEKYIKKT